MLGSLKMVRTVRVRIHEKVNINEIRSNTTPNSVLSQSNDNVESTISEPANNAQMTCVSEMPNDNIMRQSIRQKRLDDHVVYSLEQECDLSIKNNLVSFNQVVECDNSKKWSNAMKEELKSMDENEV